jgi:hypothetical protein
MLWVKKRMASEEKYSGNKMSRTVFSESGLVLESGTYDEYENPVGDRFYYWENGAKEKIEHYKDVGDDSGYEKLVAVDLWDERGSKIDEALLPADCLPELDHGKCPWGDNNTWTAKTYFDPCHNCFDSIFEAPLERSLYNMLDLAARHLRERGDLIAFDGATDRVALLMTTPRRDDSGSSDQYYRLRVARDPCSKGMKECVIRATANLIRVPVVSGERVNAEMQLLDDDITQEVIELIRGEVERSNSDFASRNDKDHRLFPPMFNPFR